MFSFSVGTVTSSVSGTSPATTLPVSPLIISPTNSPFLGYLSNSVDKKV